MQLRSVGAQEGPAAARLSGDLFQGQVGKRDHFSRFGQVRRPAVFDGLGINVQEFDDGRTTFRQAAIDGSADGRCPMVAVKYQRCLCRAGQRVAPVEGVELRLRLEPGEAGVKDSGSHKAASKNAIFVSGGDKLRP